MSTMMAKTKKAAREESKKIRPRMEPRSLKEMQQMADELRNKAAEFDALCSEMKRLNLTDIEFDGIHQFERGMILIRKFQAYWRRAIDVAILRT
jgi:hypothetical protein